MNELDEQASGLSHRLRCKVAYAGQAYAGWQFQSDAPSVQGALEAALFQVTGKNVRVAGAGRTDAGVHATGQVAHWDSHSPLEPAVLERALNAVLEPDIRVYGLERTRPDFHARFCASGREYSYRLVESAWPGSVLVRRTAWVRALGRLDRRALEEAAGCLSGEHDFSGFSRTGSDTAHNRCRVAQAGWRTEGFELLFTIHADRFLRGMVRMLVGGMLAVAAGRTTLTDFRAALEAKAHWKTAVPSPACGLVLVRVEYPKPYTF